MFVWKCVKNIWAHSRHSIRKSWAAGFSALNYCSSRYYTLATMTARMPLKGGGLNFYNNNHSLCLHSLLCKLNKTSNSCEFYSRLYFDWFYLTKGTEWKWNSSNSIQPSVCQLSMADSTGSLIFSDFQTEHSRVVFSLVTGQGERRLLSQKKMHMNLQLITQSYNSEKLP